MQLQYECYIVDVTLYGKKSLLVRETLMSEH